MSERTCPVCGKTYSDPPALSRRDDSTEICPECGTIEAMEDYADRPLRIERKGFETLAIIDVIGIPAMLEQLAEECSELSQAALKLARRYRGENPTPKSEMECIGDLTEEIADVRCCIDQLVGRLIDEERVKAVIDQKTVRWRNRIGGNENA